MKTQINIDDLTLEEKAERLENAIMYKIITRGHKPVATPDDCTEMIEICLASIGLAETKMEILWCVEDLTKESAAEFREWSRNRDKYREAIDQYTMLHRELRQEPKKIYLVN